MSPLILSSAVILGTTGGLAIGGFYLCRIARNILMAFTDLTAAADVLKGDVATLTTQSTALTGLYDAKIAALNTELADLEDPTRFDALTTELSDVHAANTTLLAAIDAGIAALTPPPATVVEPAV